MTISGSGLTVSVDKATDVKTLSLHLLLVIATASDNINQNSMIPYLLTSEMFEALIQLLVDNSQQLSLYPILLLYVILCNYHKCVPVTLTSSN